MPQTFRIVGRVVGKDADVLFRTKGVLFLHPLAGSGEMGLNGQSRRIGQRVAVVKHRRGAAKLLKQLPRHLIGDAWHVGEQVDIFRFRHG